MVVDAALGPIIRRGTEMTQGKRRRDESLKRARRSIYEVDTPFAGVVIVGRERLTPCRIQRCSGQLPIVISDKRGSASRTRSMATRENNDKDR